MAPFRKYQRLVNFRVRRRRRALERVERDAYLLARRRESALMPVTVERHVNEFGDVVL